MSQPAQPTPPPPPPPAQPLQVLVLCGLVGSGKTTLANAIQANLPNWARVNQDDLGSRQACEERLHSLLSRGMNVVLDRQNFDVAQRRGWLEIGARYPGVAVNCAVMGTTTTECRERLAVRTNHPTVDNPALALELLDRFGGLWVQPALEEGFDHLLTLPSLPPTSDLTPSLLTALLDALALSPLNPHASAQRQPQHRPRGAPASSSGFATRGFAPARFPPAPQGGAWGAPRPGAGQEQGWRSGAAYGQGQGQGQGVGPAGMGGQTWRATGGGAGAGPRGGHNWGGGGRTLG